MVQFISETTLSVTDDRMNESLTTNNTDQAGCPLPQLTFFRAASQLLAYSAIFILSMFGNCVLINAITRNYGRCSAAMNYYIINMAAADLVTTVFDIGVQVYHYAVMAMNKQFEWFDGVMGVFLCKWFAFTQGTAIACSVLTLTAIAINRFQAVMFPFRPSMRTSRALLVIGLIWISSFAIASPMLYAMRVLNSHGALYCLEDWEPLFDNQSSRGHYSLVLLFFLYVCPLVLIGLLYSLIALKVWVRTAPGQITAPHQLNETKRKKKILKICMTVVSVFAVCWLPFYVYLILNFLGDGNNGCGTPEYVAFIGLFFGHANSALNPFIYIIYNSDYQKSLKKVLLHCCCHWKSDRVRMRTIRSSLESIPSLRTFKELELTSL
ncbi:QRFP-like peptide receptor [Montipora foliosa]|uniref:QRFP-like peptide receptor n=1 Tax=Montipora foliosa TaxID=591990 RepID=UPI0035F1917D